MLNDWNGITLGWKFYTKNTYTCTHEKYKTVLLKRQKLIIYLLKTVKTRLCSKENFRGPFGLSSILGKQQQQQQHFISPHNIQEIKIFITIVQTMIGALAA